MENKFMIDDECDVGGIQAKLLVFKRPFCR